MIVFTLVTFITLVLFTNILIAYMGEAHAHVLSTMDICQGQGTTELLIELETIFGTINTCFCKCLTRKNEKPEGFYILCAEYQEDHDCGLNVEKAIEGVREELRQAKEELKKDQ